MLAGVLTAGLFPAFALARQWLLALRWDRSQAWHVAEWTETNLGQVEGKQVREAADFPASRWLARLALLLAAAAVGTAVVGLVRGVPLFRFWFADPRTATAVRVYLSLLGGSYLATWLAVNLQLRRMNGLLATVGDMTADLGEFRRRRRRWDFGIGPKSLVVGLVLAFAGVPWALPMLLATTAQRRALTVHGRRARRRPGGAAARGARPPPAGRALAAGARPGNAVREPGLRRKAAARRETLPALRGRPTAGGRPRFGMTPAGARPGAAS